MSLALQVPERSAATTQCQCRLARRQVFFKALFLACACKRSTARPFPASKSRSKSCSGQRATAIPSEESGRIRLEQLAQLVLQHAHRPRARHRLEHAALAAGELGAAVVGHVHGHRQIGRAHV